MNNFNELNNEVLVEEMETLKVVLEKTKKNQLHNRLKLLRS